MAMFVAGFGLMYLIAAFLEARSVLAWAREERIGAGTASVLLMAMLWPMTHWHLGEAAE